VLRYILDSHHAKLADFCEGVNFRWPERIASVAIQVFRALTPRDKVGLPGAAGEGPRLGFWALAALRIQMLRLVFGFTQLCQFYSDAGLGLRTAASSPACNFVIKGIGAAEITMTKPVFLELLIKVTVVPTLAQMLAGLDTQADVGRGP
jgi:hypothetical protein